MPLDDLVGLEDVADRFEAQPEDAPAARDVAGLQELAFPTYARGVYPTQMRGRAGDRQLERVDVGIAHTRGGSVPGTEGGSCGVLVCVAA